MNAPISHAAALVLLALAAILVAGAVRPIAAAAHPATASVSVTFSESSPPGGPAAEPLFPGLPAR
jgi:hypothetical protein